MMKTLKISHSAIEPHSSTLRTAYILSHRVLLFMGRGKIVWRHRIMCISQNRINFLAILFSEPNLRDPIFSRDDRSLSIVPLRDKYSNLEKILKSFGGYDE